MADLKVAEAIGNHWPDTIPRRRFVRNVLLCYQQKVQLEKQDIWQSGLPIEKTPSEEICVEVSETLPLLTCSVS